MSIIYAISDLHGQLPVIPTDAEALLIGGDICPDYSIIGHDRTGVPQADWLDTTLRSWLPDIPVVAIWGNHDYVGEHPSLVPDLPWTLLEDSETVLELPGGRIRIYGTPWVPGLPYWAFHGTERALLQRADAIPRGLDILMTHGPPYGAGDFIPTSEEQRVKYGNHRGEHVGDRALAMILPTKDPRVVICGHIHESRGTYDFPGCYGLVHNTAAVDGDYKLYRWPFTRLLEFA